MRSLICSGAKLRCTCGLGVSTLVATPRGVVHPSGRPLATTADHLPVQNITRLRSAWLPVLARARRCLEVHRCVCRSQQGRGQRRLLCAGWLVFFTWE